jgi:hypothetical protein
MLWYHSIAGDGTGQRLPVTKNRRNPERLRISPVGERLEPRCMLASHPGFVYDSTDSLVAVDPAVQAELGDLLAVISADFEASGLPEVAYSPPATLPLRQEIAWGNLAGVGGVTVSAVALPDRVDELAAGIAAVGGTRIIVAGDHVSAFIRYGLLDELATVPGLRHADAALVRLTNRAITNQAGIALEADVARARFGVDGSGIRIGVISDSFDNLGGYAFDVASGALPADVVVLKEHPIRVQDGLPQPGSDEGRAMAQLVHSIAPAAKLFFATSGNDPADFADSIEQLVAAGCEIIVDDITEGGVPWFQDGVVAQAVNAASNEAGVTYLTSAGNFGRNSYAGEFRGVVAADLGNLPTELTKSAGFVLHDFDPGPAIDVFQRVRIPAGTNEIRLAMQWDQPWAANGSDVDLFVYAADRQTLLTRLEGSHQTDGNPALGGSLPVPEGLDEVQLVIAHAGGVAPGYLKYLTYHANLEIEVLQRQQHDRRPRQFVNRRRGRCQCLFPHTRLPPGSCRIGRIQLVGWNTDPVHSRRPEACRSRNTPAAPIRRGEPRQHLVLRQRRRPRRAAQLLGHLRLGPQCGGSGSTHETARPVASTE